MSEVEVMEAEQPELDSEPQANSLEGRVMKAQDKIFSSMDDDGNVFPAYEGNGIGNKSSAKSSRYKKSSRANYSESDAPVRHAGKSTDNGSVAFIYNEETGEVAFEQKSYDYSVKSERGKLQCTGGHVDEGESSLEAIIRELEEEAVNSSAVIKALKEKGYRYNTQTAEFSGQVVYTDFWVIPLSDKEWKNFVEGGLKGEATGPLRTIPLNQAYDLSNDFYAFKSGPIVKEIMGSIQPYASHGSHSLGAIASSPFKSALYSDSIIPSYAQSVSVNPMPMQNNYFIRNSSNN
ncbi:NUDIX domain-containing protein [Candidatus Woesearchaeota archaeon]|nr:NUDIX domain-containing protein [Candidatus Woesearchaeota archaeon]